MKPTITKVKSVRGRIVAYAANIGPIRGESTSTPQEAADACEREALAALKRLDNGAMIVRWRGHVAVIAPTADGYTYWIDTSSSVFPQNSMSGRTRQDVATAALHHLAQNLWDSSVDDEAFLKDLPEPGEIRSWIGFQRAYVRLRDEGKSDVEAHRLACERRSA